MKNRSSDSWGFDTSRLMSMEQTPLHNPAIQKVNSMMYIIMNVMNDVIRENLELVLKDFIVTGDWPEC